MLLMNICQVMKEYYYPVIKEQLDIRSEYLGFKYAIIHSNDLLKHEFWRYDDLE